MKQFRWFLVLLLAGMFFLQGCGGSSSTTDSVQTIAIEKIKAYAEDQTQPVPTVEDYADAGVIGVTEDNIDEINALVAGLTAEDVDTPEEIQAILDEYNLSLNTAPVANAGTDQNVETGSIVTLDGSASSDADSDPLTYSWSLTAPAGSTSTLSDTTAVNPTFTADIAGTYTATLIVNDGTVDSASDSATITVTDPAAVNTAPKAVAMADPSDVNLSNPSALTTIALDGSYSSDKDGDPLTYSWSLTVPDGSTAILSSTTAENPEFTVDIAGIYVAALVVNDGTDDSAPNAAVVTVTDGTTDAIVGQTVEFTGINGTNFSFYPNHKFVKILCDGTCSDGTGTFDYIGYWVGSTSGDDASDLLLVDNLGNPINVTTITNSKNIYYYPVVADKLDTEHNVQGDGIRERKADGTIKFVYFRDPDATTVTAFSYFGFDIPTWDPIGAGGHWEIRDGKVYAYYGTDTNNEIGTYAFDRQPIKNTGGLILTVTKGGNLIDVITVDEYWQLKPSATIDKTQEVVPADIEETTFYDKLMLISDKVDGPWGCYFDAPLSADVNGYVTCAGIDIAGTTPWGGKGDNWYILNGTDLITKIHYEVAGSNSTTEIWRFDTAVPDAGTKVSKYDKNDIFINTSSLTDFRDF